MEGTAKTVTAAIRDAARSNPLAALGGLLMRPALGGLRRELHPDTTGGAILLGLRGIAVVGHGSSGAEGIANAVRLAARCVEVDAVGRTAALLREGGAGRGALADERARDRNPAMTREEVLTLVRDHLAEELEVEAGKIGEATRFKEDLDADSLDLYELVMELEDTLRDLRLRGAGGEDRDGRRRGRVRARARQRGAERACLALRGSEARSWF